MIAYIDCTVECSISFMHESKLQTANRFNINAIHFYGLQYKFLCTHKITPNSHYISKDRNTSLYSTHLQPFIFESIKSSSYVVNRFYCNKYSFWSNFDDSQTLQSSKVTFIAFFLSLFSKLDRYVFEKLINGFECILRDYMRFLHIILMTGSSNNVIAYNALHYDELEQS